jgi:predicted solute-binding protein
MISYTSATSVHLLEALLEGMLDRFAQVEVKRAAAAARPAAITM